MGSVEERSETYPDPAERYWDVLSWHWGMFAEGAGKIGTGTTVPVEYVQSQSRAWFFGALYRLAPHVSQDLLRSETFELLGRHDAIVDQWQAAVKIAWPDFGDQIKHATTHPLYESTVVAAEPLNRAIVAWQQSYHLTGEWLFAAAQETIRAARDAFGYPEPLRELTDHLPNGLPLMLDNVDRVAHPHIDKELYAFAHKPLNSPGWLHWTPTHKEIQLPVYLDSLKHPPQVFDDGEWEDDGWFGTFDPRTESIEAATKRLLETLRPRVRRALEAIAAEDRELNGALASVQFRTPVVFEWLVRFQVLGHSRGDIARELAAARRQRDPKWAGGEDHYKSNVGKRIREAAELVGLTLRDA